LFAFLSVCGAAAQDRSSSPDSAVTIEASPVEAVQNFAEERGSSTAGAKAAQSAYQVDDGSAETSIGYSQSVDMMWMNAFQAMGGSDTIEEISVAYNSTVPSGQAVTYLVYEDPNDDGNPVDAQLRTQVLTTIQNTNSGAFVTQSISPTTVNGTFFIAVLYRDLPVDINPALLDQSSGSQESSWVAATAPGNFNVNDLGSNPPGLIDAQGFSGNWLLRAGSDSAPATTGLSLTYNQIDAGSFPLVENFVTVSDDAGNPISGLTEANFSVREDGVSQTPITVETVGGDGSAASVALTIDRSGSMGGTPLQDAKSAATTFVDQLQPLDRAAVISFSSGVRVDQSFTTDKNALNTAISGLNAGGGTALYDAVFESINLASSEVGRRAVIALTDGGDGGSATSLQQAIDAAVQVGIPIYTIGLGNANINPLEQLATETGGQFFNAPNSSDLEQVYNQIALQLENQYRVTYTSSDACDGTEHTVEITASSNQFSDSETRTYQAPQNCPPLAVTNPATEVAGTTAMLNGTVNPNGNQTNVAFEYFPTDQPAQFRRVDAEQDPISGSGDQAVSKVVEDLEPETEYKFRVFAENSGGNARGEYLLFTTGAAVPTVQTNPATNVEATAAQLNGIVDPKGEETTVEFEYYPSASPSQAVTIPAVESPLMGEGEQSVSASPDNLEPDTEYTFFARATNSSGSATGDPLTFTTEGAPPEFTQIGPFSVSEAAPEGDPVGDVDANDGAGGATDDGVSYTITDGNDPDADGVPAFAINSGDGRIEVANAGEIDFEARQQFALEIVADNGVSTTTATADITVDDVPPPTATTGSVTDVSSVAATLQGTANPNGAETTITFAYHPEGAPGKVQTAPAEESPLTDAGAAEVSARVEGLAPGTDYVFRVVATSTEGEQRGDDQPFATPPAVPVAQADPAVDVDTTSAGLRGTVDPGGAETTVQFEYYPQGAPSQSQIVAAAESPLTGNGSQSVSAPVTGLDSNTGYTFILRADNSAGNIASNERDFKTDSFPPRVEVGPLTEEITVSGVSLRAQVNPRGADTEVKFKYFPAAQPAQVQVVEAETLLSGGVQEITAPIASLRPSTEYDVRVVATSVGGADSSQATFTTEVLRVEAAAEPSEPRRGTAAVVEATVPAGFAPSERRLFWRPGGAPGYQSVPMVAVGGGGLSEERTYAAEIPAAGVTARGLEYYVRLVEERAGGPDLVATVPETPPGGDPADDPAQAPRQLRVQVDSIAAGIALPEGAYRMISAPLALEDPRAVAALRDDFGAPDRTAWRLLRWDAAAEGYKEVTLPAGEGGAPEAELRPGQAYWLIAREGGTFDVEGARSVAGTPVTLELPPGWTQLATPRAYPVAWSDIEGTALTDASSPLTHLPAASDSAGEASGDAFATADVLQPWTGYWVYNPQAGPIELTVPNRAAEGVSPLAASGGSGAGPAGASPVGAGEDWTERLFGRTVDYGIEVVGWAVPKDSRGSATRAAVAWGEGGRAAAGAEDAFLPPPIGEHLRLSVVETAAATGAPVRLAGSLRPPGQEGYAWDLELRASPGRLATAPGGRLRVDLELRASAGSSAPPPGFEQRLIDRASGRELVASASGRARVALTPEAPVRRLRLIVGTAAYAEEAARAVVPARTALGAAYPNPSAGAVSVEYELAEAGPVEMAVYDVLGRRVRTLVTGRQAAGKHAAQWDGRSASGRPMASGLYLVRLRAGGSAYTRPVTIVR